MRRAASWVLLGARQLQRIAEIRAQEAGCVRRVVQIRWKTLWVRGLGVGTCGKRKAHH